MLFDKIRNVGVHLSLNLAEQGGLNAVALELSYLEINLWPFSVMPDIAR
jgi:hypothetical protein